MDALAVCCSSVARSHHRTRAHFRVMWQMLTFFALAMIVFCCSALGLFVAATGWRGSASYYESLTPAVGAIREVLKAKPENGQYGGFILMPVYTANFYGKYENINQVSQQQ